MTVCRQCATGLVNRFMAILIIIFGLAIQKFYLVFHFLCSQSYLSFPLWLLDFLHAWSSLPHSDLETIFFFFVEFFRFVFYY